MTVVYMPKGHDLESFLYSLESGVGYSVPSYLDGNLSDTLKSTNIVNKSFKPESETESSGTPQSSETLESLSKEDMRKPTLDTLTWSAVASLDHANPSLMPEKEKGIKTPEICGLKLSTWFAELHQNFVFSRTSLGYYPPVTSEKSSLTWPKAGIVSAGEFYRQPNWERRINVIGSGLLHTPTVADSRGIKRSLEGWEKRAAFRQSIGRDHIAPAGLSEQIWLEENQIPLMISKWPTPTVDDANNVSRKSGQYQSLSRAFFQATDGGTLNPRFVEWLMGMPDGWLNLEPLAMPKFLKWQQQRGDYLLENKKFSGNSDSKDAI